MENVITTRIRFDCSEEQFKEILWFIKTNEDKYKYRLYKNEDTFVRLISKTEITNEFLKAIEDKFSTIDFGGAIIINDNNTFTRFRYRDGEEETWEDTLLEE